MLLFSLALIMYEAAAHGDSNGNGISFLGDEHWAGEHKIQCDEGNINWWKAELKCFSNVKFPYKINSELLAVNPILIVYRGFASSSEIKNFLVDVERKQLIAQKVVNFKGGSSESNARRANGTWINHEEMPNIANVFKKAESLLPNIHFRTGENWQVLSYNPGGHYAPHHDYLNYESENQYDWWMKRYGNRFATFLLILKTADEGGGTVFPLINTTVRPNAGDVIFWTNMDGNESQAQLSLHGACPIYKGQKIAATIWLRKHGQPAMDASHGVDLDYEPFINVNPIRTCLKRI